MIPAPPRRSALHNLALLLRLRLRTLRRAPAGRSGRAQRLPGWSRYLLLLLVAGVIVANLAGRVDLVGGAAGRVLLSPVLTWASSTAALLLFLFAIPLAVATFTYRSDLRLLLLTPLSPSVIMLEKFVQVYCQISLFLWAIGIPLLLGIGGTLAWAGATAWRWSRCCSCCRPYRWRWRCCFWRWWYAGYRRDRRARSPPSLAPCWPSPSTWGASLSSKGAGQSSDLRTLFTQSAGAWWQNLPTTWPGRAVAAAGQGDPGTAMPICRHRRTLDRVVYAGTGAAGAPVRHRLGHLPGSRE